MSNNIIDGLKKYIAEHKDEHSVMGKLEDDSYVIIVESTEKAPVKVLRKYGRIINKDRQQGGSEK